MASSFRIVSACKDKVAVPFDRGIVPTEQVILKEDVVNLGYKDDIVTVKDGYGRNFLIPTGKAVIASESAKKVLAENLKQRAHKLAKIKEDAQTLAAKLDDFRFLLLAAYSAAYLS